LLTGKGGRERGAGTKSIGHSIYESLVSEIGLIISQNTATIEKERMKEKCIIKNEDPN